MPRSLKEIGTLVQNSLPVISSSFKLFVKDGIKTNDNGDAVTTHTSSSPTTKASHNIVIGINPKYEVKDYYIDFQSWKNIFEAYFNTTNEESMSIYTALWTQSSMSETQKLMFKSSQGGEIDIRICYTLDVVSSRTFYSKLDGNIGVSLVEDKILMMPTGQCALSTNKRVDENGNVQQIKSFEITTGCNFYINAKDSQPNVNQFEDDIHTLIETLQIPSIVETIKKQLVYTLAHELMHSLYYCNPDSYIHSPKSTLHFCEYLHKRKNRKLAPPVTLDPPHAPNYFAAEIQYLYYISHHQEMICRAFESYYGGDATPVYTSTVHSITLFRQCAYNVIETMINRLTMDAVEETELSQLLEKFKPVSRTFIEAYSMLKKYDEPVEELFSHEAQTQRTSLIAAYDKLLVRALCPLTMRNPYSLVKYCIEKNVNKQYIIEFLQVFIRSLNRLENVAQHSLEKYTEKSNRFAKLGKLNNLN